jgi:hypothetical protein
MINWGHGVFLHHDKCMSFKRIDVTYSRNEAELYFDFSTVAYDNNITKHIQCTSL